MGLLVQSTFQTPEGIPLTSFYSRITFIMYQVPNGITIRHSTYVSRDRRLDNCNPVRVPNLDEIIQIPGGLGDMSYFYQKFKEYLQSKGYTVEDVLEDGQQVSAG